MVDILTISWFLGIMGLVIGALGFLYFIRGIKNLVIDDETKKSLTYLFIVSLLAHVYHIFVIIFWFSEINFMNKLWIVLPLIYICMGILWYFGTYNLLKIVREVQENG